MMGLLNRINLTEETDNDPASVWVSKAILKLQNELANPVCMEDLVAEFPISYSSFRKSFKRITGESPNQYHLNLRLNKAEELLKTTHLTVTEIRSEEHTSELQSLMRISYAVFCLKKTKD